MNKVIEDGSLVLVSVDHLEDHFALLWGHLLGVSAVGDGFVFVVLQTDLSKLGIGDIFDIDPFDFELTWKWFNRDFLVNSLQLRFSIKQKPHRFEQKCLN